ncbi:MAG: hypothetical protein ACE5HT_00855 [Gemmatimonadales bacterium]
MKRIAAVVFIVSMLCAMPVSPADAQIFNQPVYYAPGHGTGVTLAADIGVGANDDSKLVAGETPVAYGGRITLGLPVVTITAGVSSVDPKGTLENEVALGGNLALTLFKAPMAPVVVALQGGAGYVKFNGTGFENRVVDVPIGLALGVSVPNPSVSFEPWIAPRIHIRNQRVMTGGVTVDETKAGFGVSGGFNLGLPMGLGFHAAVDVMTIDNAFGANVSPVVFGAGIHYKFNVPSLGIPGGVL